ncbi:hypothetical protein [Metabacillus fastidiosus]|uniref:hypothetical protein n=1 Tax=Metabacillus fastidiosus TaxID=1458 RepID=UPI0008262320|nr:hypothetical protein [Metabacillus fastidiosus]
MNTINLVQEKKVGKKKSWFNTLLNLLPLRKLECKECDTNSTLGLGNIRHSKKNYEGPFCPKCGSKINISMLFSKKEKSS